jgi:chemotaxis protein MotB
MRPSRTRSCLRVDGLLAAALAAVAVCSCVGRGTYNEVVQERDHLSAELARAKATTQSLDRERVALMEQLEDLRQKRTTLEANVDRLRRTEAELSAALKQSESDLAERNEELAALRGTYTDLVAELEAEVAAGQIQIEQLREGLRLNVAQDILFASGSTELNASGVEVLQKVAAQLKKLPHRVEVQGHTDNVPVKPNSRFPSNWELAAERATQVVRLFAAEGVDPTRMRAVSFGEFHPVASNDTPEGRLKNRRIEIRLEPVDAPDLVQESGEAGS